MFFLMMIIVNICIFYGLLNLYKGVSTYINADYYILKSLTFVSFAIFNIMLYLVVTQHKEFEEVKRYHSKTEMMILDTQDQIKDLSFSSNY